MIVSIYRLRNAIREFKARWWGERPRQPLRLDGIKRFIRSRRHFCVGSATKRLAGGAVGRDAPPEQDCSKVVLWFASFLRLVSRRLLAISVAGISCVTRGIDGLVRVAVHWQILFAHSLPRRVTGRFGLVPI